MNFNKNILLFQILLLLLNSDLYSQTKSIYYPIFVESINSNSSVLPTAIKKGTTINKSGSSFDFNGRYFIRDGKPWLPVVGELSYSRIPKGNWNDILNKFKSSGINIVSSYVFWIHHEEEEGKWNWSENKNLKEFLMLCKKKGLLVILRIGPWCHGEVRNGGFPDWILMKASLEYPDAKRLDSKLRQNPTDWYLKAVYEFYKQISLNTTGQYFKDGGPIVGLQIENEYGWSKQSSADYMYKLKDMILKLGMDVPLYTHFSPDYPPGQNDFMPMKGAYCDAPWSNSIERLIRENRFQFSSITFDSEVGADLYGKRKDIEASILFPSGMAEFGGGFQVTYHRRPLLYKGDIASSAYVNVGSGANLFGYYMFHGGSNPLGKKSTLQESRNTNYPNDVPTISYDFQAPIREWGQANDDLAELRILNLSLNNFGDRISQMHSYIPSKEGAKNLRYGIRINGKEGCLFFNNHTRYLSSPDIKDVQFEFITGKLRSKPWPTKPITISSDVYGFFPFGWDMEDAHLNWSTAQPVCLLNNKDIKTWVFTAIKGIPVEYDFSPECILKQEKNGNIIRITTASGKEIQILTLSRQEAQTLYKVKSGGKEYIILSNAMVTYDDDTIRFQLWEGNNLLWKSFPVIEQTLLNKAIIENHFSVFKQNFPLHTPKLLNENKMVARPMNEHISKQTMPGQLYGATFCMVPGSTTWKLKILGDTLDDAKDYLVEVEFTGDNIALYNHDLLVADDYQKGEPMRFLLNRVTNNEYKKADLKLQIMPFTEYRQIYLEDASLKEKGLFADIKKITLKPVYETKISF